MNHLFTVKEGIGFVGWVTVSPKPALYIKENFDQALFYGNRVVKEYKGKEDIHVEWMQAYTGAIKELQDYVGTNNTTGLVWNPDGVELTQVSSAPNTGAAVPTTPAIATITEPRGRMQGGLASAINKGGTITRGLKKVTDYMKTHKNPELRQSSLVKTLERKPKVASPAPDLALPLLLKSVLKWSYRTTSG